MTNEYSPLRFAFGSFLALLSYPFLIEPYVRLRTQAWIWSGSYVAFAILCGVVAWTSRPAAFSSPSTTAAVPSTTTER